MSFTKLLCFSALALSSFGFRSRVRRTGESTALVARSGDCESLGNITVVGRDLGQAATLLCQFWPGSFGEFPVDNAHKIVDIVNKGEDIWKKIKELAKGDPSRTPFCWKKAVTRELISALTLTDNLNISSSLASSNCEMQVLGKCYGSCPAGMKPMTLVGSFAPACTSECKTQTSHKTSCGLGCATGIRSCTTTLVNQVSTVANAVGMVASYMTGNPIIHEAVDKILSLVGFFIDTVFDVVLVAQKVYKEWPRDEANLGVIIALLQFVLEHAKTIGQNFLHLNKMFGETMELILEVIDAEFEWKTINLEFLSDTILKHGIAILDGAYEFATAFIFPTCPLA